MTTPLNSREWEKEFDQKFVADLSDREPQDQYWNVIQNDYSIKSFIKSLLSHQLEEVRTDTIGNIGAKLLARHSPQIVLDAYFDVANEELEANEEENETNN